MVAIGTEIKSRMPANDDKMRKVEMDYDLKMAHTTRSERLSFLQNKLVNNQTLQLNLLYSAPMVEIVIYN